MQGDWGGVAGSQRRVELRLNFSYLTQTSMEVAQERLERFIQVGAVTRQVQDKQLVLKRLSCKEHLQQGHVPFRRDCAVCQRAAARQRPHRSQEHPEGHVLALDVCGPLKLGMDIDNEEKKYLLVGTYTWPVDGEPPECELDKVEDELPDDEPPLLEGDAKVPLESDYTPSLLAERPGGAAG